MATPEKGRDKPVSKPQPPEKPITLDRGWLQIVKKGGSKPEITK